MEDALYDYDSAGSPAARAVAAAALAEVVREHVEVDGGKCGFKRGRQSTQSLAPPYPSPTHGTYQVGLTMYKSGYPVTIDSVTYPTAWNAFQACKAAPSERGRYANVSWVEATQLGRQEHIDVAFWDTQRETLMHSILVAQASTHPAFEKVILKYGHKKLHDNSMSDMFWSSVLPSMWAKVRTTLKENKSEEDESEEDESEEDESEEDESEEDEDEEDEDDMLQNEPATEPPASQVLDTRPLQRRIM